MCKTRKISRSISLKQDQWDYLDSQIQKNNSEWMREAFEMKKESEDIKKAST